MSGRRNKQRGYELEAEAVAEARAAGIDAKRRGEFFCAGAPHTVKVKRWRGRAESR